MFLYWKTQYCYKENSTQIDVQVQCNPYEIPSYLSTETEIANNIKKSE